MLTFEREYPNGLALATVAMQLGLPVYWETTGGRMDIEIHYVSQADAATLVQLEIAELSAHSRPAVNP